MQLRVWAIQTNASPSCKELCSLASYQPSEEVWLTQHVALELSKNLIIFSTLRQPNLGKNLEK